MCIHKKKLDERENKAVEKIKTDPNFFYSFAKSVVKIKSTINMLIDSNQDITTDPQKMADLLQEQLSSVFSNPKLPLTPDPTLTGSRSTSNLVTGISCLLSLVYPPNSSGPNGEPSILLKNCAKELCCPIRIIWEESFECGTVPKFYKDTHITPIFKKGDRARAANYSPIDLASHIIKAYERVLRGVMVDFIDKNQLLCNNQHEFRLGRSCLAQLLSHVDDIVQGSVRHAIYLYVEISRM